MAGFPKKPKPKEIETDPGAWNRFEHAVDAAVKSGPKHRTAKPHKPKSKGVDLKRTVQDNKPVAD